MLLYAQVRLPAHLVAERTRNGGGNACVSARVCEGAWGGGGVGEFADINSREQVRWGSGIYRQIKIQIGAELEDVGDRDLRGAACRRVSMGG